MTCIVGYEYDGKVYMGGDSAGISGYNLMISKSDKVFTRGKFLIGYTSSFRMGQVLRFQLSVPHQNEDQDDYEYMCTTFIDTVIKLFKDSCFIKEDDNEGGTFLVGYKNKLYVIEDDFQVQIVEDNFYACGCGFNIALGAMKVLHEYATDLSPQEKVKKALEIAERFSAGVRAPFIILSQEI